MNYTVTVEIKTTVEFEVQCEEYKEAVQIVSDCFNNNEIGLVMKRDDLYGEGAIGTHKTVSSTKDYISVVPMLNEDIYVEEERK